MTLYKNIEEVILALTKMAGIDLLRDTPRFIALMSDYAPNLADEQRLIRKFSRSGGMSVLIDDVISREKYEKVFTNICIYALKATGDIEKCKEIVKIIRLLPAVLDSYYTTALNAKELYNAGMQYFRRLPKDINIPIAILLFEEAFRLGSVDAPLYIARTYLKGKGVSQNIEKGMYYLELAAANKNTRAIIELAECLWKGNNTRVDISRSVSLLKGLDDPHAMFTLSEIYKENMEYDKAVEYLVRAAERNHVYAQYNLAVAYATGQGTKRNTAKAKHWLRSAALLGHNEARVKLEELGEEWN